MVLESTMICLDNSDWMRNGDYVPRRLDAQQDAASMICNDRTSSNPENTVGILTMAGQGVDLLVSPTEEIGKILAAFASVNLGGKSSDLPTAVQIAQLALKHRKNKNGGQRIIAFVGGPLVETVAVYQKIGKQLKKNNVAIDIISIGEIDDNNDKLTELVNATNSNDNSHLIVVPAGVSPVNALMSSPVMHGDGGNAMMGGGGAGGAGGADNFDMYGGIDPSMDPELAMAIRVSTEEARAEEEARVRATQGQSAASSSSSSAAFHANDVSGEDFGGFGAEDEDDEEALIQRALEMSMLDAQVTSAPTNAVSGSAAVESTPVRSGVEMEVPDEEDDEEAELRRALQLSVSGAAADSEPSAAFVDADFVSQLLGASGQDDPLIQAALAQLTETKPAEGDEDASKKRKGDDR